MLEHDLARELRLAMLARQLRLTIQHKVDVRSLAIIGGEVLLQWQHRERGLIPAQRWVQIAESHGLMPQLSQWLFNQVLQHIISQRHISYPLSINISPSCLDLDFAQHIVDRITEAKLPPKQLEIEITESSQAPCMKILATAIKILRRHGVTVSLDDFGSGYSTMRYLVELEVDTIKIDASITQAAVHNQNARSILKMLIDLGHELNLTTLCEGVETQEHMNMIRFLGVQQAQGYLFGKPAPLHDDTMKHLNQANSQKKHLAMA